MPDYLLRLLDLRGVDPQARGKLLEAASVMAGLKAADIAALEKYETVVGLEEGDAGPERKAREWRAFGQEFPAYAELAMARAEQWDVRGRQKQEGDQILARSRAARDEDWSKLFRLLALKTISKDDKAKWALQFAESYISSPGIEPWMAARMVRALPLGAMRSRIEKIAKSPATESPLKPIKVDGKYGYADRRGHIIIAPQYDRADDFYEMLAAVAVQQSGPDCVLGHSMKLFTDVPGGRLVYPCKSLMGYIDQSGEMKIEPKFMSARRFNSGLAAVSDSEGKWGFIDRAGRVVGQIQFDAVREFSEGYAPVQIGGSRMGRFGDLWKGGRWGYIDERGEFVIEPQFDDEPGAFISGRAFVHTNSGFIHIDTQGVRREP